MKDTDMQTVDPELKGALERFPGFDITAEFLSAIRKFPAKPPRSTPDYKEVFIGTEGEKNPLRCLIIDPIPDADNRPAMLYFHGGGYIFGSPEITLPTAQKLAEDVGCLIILPDYRLAPEHPFPAALEDGLRVLSWLKVNEDRLRLDTACIAIGGDSAGGGHAVVLTAAIDEKTSIVPSYLFLAYPMLDNDTGADGEGGTSIWTPANNRFGWQSYLGSGDILEKIANGAVPSKIDDVKNFPPTFLATGNLDLFYNENLEFVKKLQIQGVTTEQRIFEGAYHGFDVLVPEAKVSQDFHKTCVDCLKSHFNIK